MAPKYKIEPVEYNYTYKPIGKHPDGRLFAVKLTNPTGLYVVDKDLNLVSTLTDSFPSYINNCVFLSTGTMLCWGTYIDALLDTNIYRSDDLTYSSFSIVHTLPRPNLFIEKSVGVSSKDDTIMCAEYTIARPIVYGSDRQPPTQSVWRGTNDGRDWEIVYTINRNPQFEGDTEVIRHLHAVVYDPYGDKFWLASGDGLTNETTAAAEDERFGFENKVITISPDGSTVEKIGEGSQRWRTTGFQFTPDYVVFGTDSNWLSSSYFRRYNRSTKTIEDTLKNDDCIRIIDKFKTVWGDIFIANKTFESGAENTGRTVQMFVCHDLENANEWYEACKWNVANAGVLSVFFNLIDNKDNRIYGNVSNLKDADGNSHNNVTVVMDIINLDGDPPLEPEEPPIDEETPAGFISLGVGGENVSMPFYAISDTVEGKIKIRANGQTYRIKLKDPTATSKVKAFVDGQIKEIYIE